jgi:CTP synthase (UTP-ammonia lyase)
VTGIPDADHEESAPGAPRLIISRLAGSLAGKTQTIRIAPDSMAHQAYGQAEVLEQFYCNYGLNPTFRQAVNKGPLKVSGADLDGEVRIVELPDHPFYIATLFLPQVFSMPERPHPLIVALLKCAQTFKP